jgi:ElaB/YqjD/DUF883 family membrane-anchored ribosome-binding protein
MATAISGSTFRRAIADVWPDAEAVEENVRKARRAYLDGRRATEDLLATGALSVRKHPLAAVGMAAGAGLVVGYLAGFLGGRCTRT